MRLDPFKLFESCCTLNVQTPSTANLKMILIDDPESTFTEQLMQSAYLFDIT